MRRYKDNQGFTVIELLIATAVFSVVLLVFLTAFLRISEMFYKGVNLSNTQEVSRNLVQSIGNDVQFYHFAPNLYLSQNYFCIGSHRYTFVKGVQYLPGSNYGVVKENTNCVSPSSQPPNLAKAQEMLDPGMQLNDIQISCPLGACTISTHIVYYGNDPTVLWPNATDPKAECTGPPTSTQYCATADYSTTILQNY